MSETKKESAGFTPQDRLISILPSVVTGIITLVIIVITTIYSFPPRDPTFKILINLFGIFGIVYLGFYYFLFTYFNRNIFAWVNAVLSAVVLEILVYLVPNEIDILVYALLYIAAISSSLMSGRGPSYLLVTVFTILFYLIRWEQAALQYEWSIHIALTFSAFMTIETVQQLKQVARQQINRLEIINNLSREIVSTLETKQVFSLLNAVFQNALEADTYYIGILTGDELRLELLYDDGEYYEGLKLNKKGTLSNWVITNQKELFLPDLRKEIELEGVQSTAIGMEKRPALSWVGAPIHGLHIEGVMAISSYRPNVFNRGDLELLSSIAQRAALALDNAFQHALVEEQARLDSLTRVYNHGYFIQKLREQAEECNALKQPLSIIMLDIDYFKQYNDMFGHLIGDEVLVSLCNIIRSHIKSTDAAGRWGGEEFSISLPNANRSQALQIAQRIQASMKSIKIDNNVQATERVPTVSQGIAVFPDETTDINKLIDIADKRLYVAKERGRNQIEAAPALPVQTTTD